MTKLLLRLFVKDYSQKDNPQVRTRVGKLSGGVGIFCNLLLCVGKLIAGTLSGSVAITADAVNNLSDASSSIVTLVGFRLAERPADEDHPYGHARFEYLSGLAVAALIILIGFELAKTSLDKILHPAAVDFSLPVALVLVASVVVKLWMMLFNRKLGKYINSGTLLATAADSRNDVITTSTVLAAGVVQWLTQWQIDGYMGFLVALFILYSGVGIAKDTISPLLGEAASPELRQTIVDLVGSDPWVLGYHDLMVHDYGPGQRFASLHVEMDSSREPLACHERIDNLERRCLQEHNVHLVIHYDPVVVGDPRVDGLQKQVQQILTQIDSRLSIHDFRVVFGNDHTNVIFDMEVPASLKSQEKNLKKQVEQGLRQANGETYYAVITFDQGAFQ